MTAAPLDPAVEAWFVVFTCGCSETHVNRDGLHDVCPGHHRHPILSPEWLPRCIHLGHDCGREPCANGGESE